MISPDIEAKMDKALGELRALHLRAYGTVQGAFVVGDVVGSSTSRDASLNALETLGTRIGLLANETRARVERGEVSEGQWFLWADEVARDILYIANDAGTWSAYGVVSGAARATAQDVKKAAVPVAIGVGSIALVLVGLYLLLLFK